VIKVGIHGDLWTDKHTVNWIAGFLFTNTVEEQYDVGRGVTSDQILTEVEVSILVFHKN
jgi:hypothetical protein